MELSILFLVQFGLLSGHLLGNSSVDYVLFVFSLFVILVISSFGFESWIWILIASVPGLCILFTLLVYGGIRCPSVHIFKQLLYPQFVLGPGEERIRHNIKNDYSLLPVTIKITAIYRQFLAQCD